MFHFYVWKENTKLAKRSKEKETESRNTTGNNEVSNIIMGEEKRERTVRAENFNHIMKIPNARIDIREIKHSLCSWSIAFPKKQKERRKKNV